MLTILDKYILPATFSLLPAEMGTPEAHVLLLAIALQESKAQHRKQIGGPARGFLQFEQGGVKGVLSHQASSKHATKLWADLGYRPTSISIAEVHLALEHNDILACGLARLLLWTLPTAIPTIGSPGAAALAWGQYVEAWRPGKPHPETWPGHYRRAAEVFPTFPPVLNA